MKYRVLKEMVGLSGCLFRPGHVFTKEGEISEDDRNFYASLLINDFIEEIKDEPWKPNSGQSYIFVQSDGNTNNTFWCNDPYDKERYAIGNCFQTKEQAEKAVEWLKAFKVLRDDMKGHKPHFGDEQLFTVIYDYDEGELRTDVACWEQHGLIYFLSDDDATDSIKKHKKEWLAFFGVER